MPSKAAYEFGPFRLDPANRVLLRDGSPVSLPSKALDALIVFAESGGHLISKDEMMRAIWTDSHVDEANLTQTIFVLRKALGESASEQRYIATVAGHGYRFAADIRQVAVNGQLPAETPAILTPATQSQHGKPRFRVRPAIALAGMALILGTIVVLWPRFRAFPASNHRTSLAVLPFENLTGDASQDYFSDGLTEEMIVQLERADPEHLEVVASASATRYKEQHASLQQIRQDLGVQYLLEGSVRRDANHVRISAKLIQTREQSYLWAKQYDRELTDLLTLQSEIAHDIADEIRGTLGAGYARSASVTPTVSSPTNFDTYDLYLKGRYFWNKRTPEALLQAIEYFQRATQKDPSYARAYAGLADSYSLYSGYSLTPAKESMPKARAAAIRALALDQNSAEAHTSMAVIAQNYDWDWKTAEKEYRRAIELDPNYATARHWYAEFLGLQGRFSEAFSEMDHARRLDPLSLIIASDNAAILYYSRQYDRAIAQFRSVLEMQPDFPRARMLIYAYAEKHMFTDALFEAKQWHGSEDAVGRWSDLGYLYGRSGQIALAREALEKLQRQYKQKQMDPALILSAYIGVGDKDQAFSCLDLEYEQRSSNLTNLKVSPLYDPLRKDPRFRMMLDRLRLR